MSPGCHPAAEAPLHVLTAHTPLVPNQAPDKPTVPCFLQNSGTSTRSCEIQVPHISETENLEWGEGPEHALPSKS